MKHHTLVSSGRWGGEGRSEGTDVDDDVVKGIDRV